MKILMVCLGNICRSPLAEGIMHQKITAHRLDWHIDSAGTGNWHSGQKPDHRSIAIAQKYQVDISAQRARQFKTTDFDQFDYIFAMDSQNQRDILRLSSNPEHHKKVSLIMNLIHPSQNISVPDPYYDDNGFENVYQMLDGACDAFIKQHKP